MATKRKNASLRKFKKSIKKTISKRSRSAFARDVVRPKRKASAARRKAKRSSNPKMLLFSSKAAARKYAKEHGAKRYRITKVKRAK